MRGRKAWIVAGVIASPILVVAGVIAWIGFVHPMLVQVDKSSYVKRNDALLATLPRYHTAKLLYVYSYGERDPHVGLGENGGPYWGYITKRTYTLAKDSSCASVDDFYRLTLPTQGWTQTGFDPDYEEYQRPDSALLLIECTSIPNRHTLSLAVDYHFAHDQAKPTRTRVPERWPTRGVAGGLP